MDLINSDDYEENQHILVKSDSSVLSTGEDGKPLSLSSNIKSTLHSKEKMHDHLAQTTIVIEDPSEAERIFFEFGK